MVFVLFQLLLRPPGAPPGETAVKPDMEADTEPLMECQDVMQLSRILQDNSDEPQKAQQEHGNLAQLGAQNLILATYV